MEYILEKIERLRDADEPTRRRVLYGIVAATVLVLGIVWFLLFQHRISSAVRSTADTESTLPSVSEVMRRGGSATFESLRSLLAGFILHDDAGVPAEDVPVAPSTTRRGTLPKSE